MKIAAASCCTALLAGLWTGVGALLFQAFIVHGGVDADLRPYYFFIGAIPFFWIPLFLFVFGSPIGSLTRQMSEALGRGFCWMGGVALVVLPGLPVISSLYAS